MTSLFDLRTACERVFGSLAILLLASAAAAQQPPYDVFPPAEPPYYRVRYEASKEPGELIYPVNYTIWIPPGAKALRGVIVHQHGCGEGSCRSGLTGAYDLHWQALAKKHDCALLSPSYEQPEKADCQMWCDPRNGSGKAFEKCLVDLAEMSARPELATVPWALWGHSGGGHWAGGMVMLHPERVAAAWLRSGVPLLAADPARAGIQPHSLTEGALKTPIMCNLGTKEGVTVKDGGFGGVWPANQVFFDEVRSKGGLIGVAIDPFSSHDCGNQRYLAIPWLDACLDLRLPEFSGEPLKEMPTRDAYLAESTGSVAVPEKEFPGEALKATWLPNEAVARAWMQYVKDTAVEDATPPPAPINLRVSGKELAWEAEADLESGLASFVIERDGRFLASVPETGQNPFGRPILQNLQYSDTPTQPLVPFRFVDSTATQDETHSYRVMAVNTVGLKSKPSADAVAEAADSIAVDKARPAEDGTLWYDVKLLGLEGQGWSDVSAPFDRLPAKAKGTVRDDVWSLSRQSAGLCVRFVTDAAKLQARWELMSENLAMPHMPATGVSGLDLYVRDDRKEWRWAANGRPTGKVNSVVLFDGLEPKQREYLLYLPLYNGVVSVELGLSNGARLAAAKPYPAARNKPIVFYGTSITQGGCASRPGTVHTAILGRRLNFPVVNLGFSGNGQMEPEVAKLLAEIDASAYVIDCLPNISSQQVKERTEPLVAILRENRPTTPILLVEDRTYSDAFLVAGKRRRNDESRAELKTAFERLKKAGDKHLYYLEGERLLGDDNEGTVDSSHPTDLGFFRQAAAFEAVLRPILLLEENAKE